MAQLRVFSPDGPQAQGQVVPLLREQLVIGRDPGCDLVLQGAGASRRHLQLTRGPAGWTLLDLGSANGTLVQGQRVQSHPLRHGDTIQLGDSRLVFEDAPVPGASSPPPPPAPPPPAAPRCSRCGAPSAPGNRFCGGCGLPLSGPPAAAPRKKRGGCLWLAGCGCLLALLLLAGLAAFILWRAGGLEGLNRRSIHLPRAGLQEPIRSPGIRPDPGALACISPAQRPQLPR